MSKSVLYRWLEGESIRDLAGSPSRRRWKAGEAVEHALRVELAAVQKRIQAVDVAGEKASRERDAMAETARKFNLLLAELGGQAEAVALCFGEWPEVDATPLKCGCLPRKHHFYRGYFCGKGAQARAMQRTMEWLANVVRARATADSKVTTT